MVLVQTWPFLSTFFFRQYRQGKGLSRYSRTKKLHSRLKKTRRLNSQHGPWFWSKNGHFSKVFFLGNIGKENAFYDILERKNSCLGYKKTSSKRRKIDIFWNGLTDGFCPKMTILPSCFLRQYRQRKCLSQYSRTKERPSRL